MFITRDDYTKRQQRVNEIIRSIYLPNVTIIDTGEEIFGSEQKRQIYGDRSYYKDNDHLTRTGASVLLGSTVGSVMSKIADGSSK